MGQEFYVIKCFSCELYQVHIVKKAKKWACKVCGAKQSVGKVYGQGSAKDCRLHVQKLNDPSQNINIGDHQIVCNAHETTDGNFEGDFDGYSLEMNREEHEENVKCTDILPVPKEKPSKWQKYIEPDTNIENEDSELKPTICNFEHEVSEEARCIECDTKTNVNPSDDKILQFFSNDDFDVDAVLDL